MPREVNQGRREVEAIASVAARPERPGRRRVAPLLLVALDPHAEPIRPPPRRPVALAAVLGVVALLVVALVHITALRVALPLVLATAAVVVLRRTPAAPAVPPAPAEIASTPRRSRPSGVGLVPCAPRVVRLDGERLVFEGAPATTLLELDGPFGITLLASPQRDRVVAMVSSPVGTYTLGAVFDEPARRAFAALLDRALTVAPDDTGLEAIGPDGEALLFAPADLAALVDALAEESPACLDRFVLTDARGAALTLDGRHLCVGERAVDLQAPLEWRSIVFQEAFGHAVAVYQGTWVRQGGTELVLVSLLPQLGPPPGADLDPSQIDRAVLRDLRLMVATPEQPPPAEQRVAIERLFMLPVRSALDRAPRASHPSNRAQA